MMARVAEAVADADALLAIVDLSSPDPRAVLAMVQPGADWAGPPLAVVSPAHPLRSCTRLHLGHLGVHLGQSSLPQGPRLHSGALLLRFLDGGRRCRWWCHC